jgi:hypothetical protein
MRNDGRRGKAGDLEKSTGELVVTKLSSVSPGNERNEGTRMVTKSDSMLSEKERMKKRLENLWTLSPTKSPMKCSKKTIIATPSMIAEERRMKDNLRNLWTLSGGMSVDIIPEDDDVSECVEEERMPDSGFIHSKISDAEGGKDKEWTSEKEEKVRIHQGQGYGLIQDYVVEEEEEVREAQAHHNNPGTVRRVLRPVEIEWEDESDSGYADEELDPAKLRHVSSPSTKNKLLPSKRPEWAEKTS